MLKCIRENTPCLPVSWVDFVLRRPLPVVLLALLATAGVLRFTIANFRVNTDVTEMISNELPFRQAHLNYLEAFPELRNRLVLIVESPTPETARHAREVLARRLAAAEVFRSVDVPGGGPFFTRNGLLYLSVEELENLSDNLAQVQPFLGMLPEKLTLESFFAMLADFIRQGDQELFANDRILLLFAGLAEAMESAANGQLRQLSWQEVMLGQELEEAQLREFILLQPLLDYTSLYPAREAIDTVRRLAAEVQDEPDLAGVRLRLTGSIALRQADLESVQSGTAMAAAISFGLVTLFLIIGLRSGWLVTASLLTLVMGLIWTMGFAMAAIGSLNLISIAFVVLFIGLGVDYSIQICLRFRELLAAGDERRAAVRQATMEMGNPLLLCAITTAIGFYAFVPTAYAGASELGIISGTGMFIFLFVNLTVLPALLILLPLKRPAAAARGRGVPFDSLPRRFGRPILAGAGLLAVASLFLVPRVGFDFSPLALSNPRAEAVVAARELFTTGRTSLWTITVLEETMAQARETASRLELLAEVETALTIASFVPGRQEEKLAILEETGLFMPPLPGPPDLRALDVGRSYEALAALDRALRELESDAPERPPLPPEVGALAAAGARLLGLSGSDRAAAALALLNRGVLFNLGLALGHLDGMLAPQPVALADLPSELVAQYVSRDGRYRVQVFPREDLTEVKNLAAFVAAVRTVAPRATDTPVNILETGNAIIGSFKRAALYALALITIFLLAVLRSRGETALILIPLLLAVLYTAAASVLFAIQFNYANVIVIPLLLGIGIDYGIHLIFRHRSGLAGDRHLLETSTARAVLFSALTTIMSFGSLSFSTHRGTASMGILLTICNVLMIVCTLTILPAILTVFDPAHHRVAPVEEDAGRHP